MPLQPGGHLGPYAIVGFVGAGGMGEVYRARDPRLNRDVAIKVLHASVAADPERLRRFTAEAQAVAALNHPNVLTIHEVGTQGEHPFIATELLEGTTLRALVEQGLRQVVAEKKRKRLFRLRKASFRGEGLRPELAGAGWERIRDLAYESRS